MLREENLILHLKLFFQMHIFGYLPNALPFSHWRDCGLVVRYGEWRRNLFPVSLLQRGQICNTHFHPHRPPPPQKHHHPQKHLLVNFFASPQFAQFVAGTGPNTEIRPPERLFLCHSLLLSALSPENVSQKRL